MKEGPLVIVGLPVYNGEKSIERVINSLLTQDYQNIEIFVVDNCSTDGTERVIHEIARRDGRVKYFKNASNIGMVNNFNRALDLAREARPDFYMWASHDDFYESSFIGKMVKALQENEELLLATSFTSCRKNNVEMFVDHGKDITDRSPMKRFCNYRRLLDTDGYIGSLFYGVIRFEAALKIGPIPNVICGDHIPLFELILQGGFVTIPQPLFLKSFGGASATLAGLKKTQGLSNKQFHFHFPYLNREFMIFSLVWHDDKITVLQKIGCSLYSTYCYVSFSILRNDARKFKSILKTQLLKLFNFVKNQKPV